VKIVDDDRNMHQTALGSVKGVHERSLMDGHGCVAAGVGAARAYRPTSS
jgi:hypothetical protein